MKLNEVMSLLTEDVEQLKQILSTPKYSNARENKVFFFRGARTGQGLQKRDTRTRTTERDSLSGSNSMLSWMKKSPAWKAVPNRARSVFVTGQVEHARRFGVIHAIIPSNDVKMGMVQAEDFNDDGVNDFLNGDDFRTGIENVLQCIAYEGWCKDQLISYQQLTRWVNDAMSDLPYVVEQMDDFVKELDPTKRARAVEVAFSALNAGDLQAIGELYKQHGGNLMSVFEEVLSPKSCKVQAVQPSRQVMNSKYEVWFEGEYVAVELTAEVYELLR